MQAVHNYGRRATDAKVFIPAIRGYNNMPSNQKVSFWLRICSVVVIALTFLQGRPPTFAQVLTQPVISIEDAVQDEKLNNFHTFQNNQDNWNHETGTEISTLKDDVSNIKGEIVGVGLALGGLNILGLFFQLKKQKE